MVEKTTPQPNDSISVGDQIWRTEDWQADQMKKVNLLFNDLNKNQNKIKSATLTKTKSGNYYLSILIDRENEKILSNINKIIGIDVGIIER